jgi:hypothetical protein
MPTRSGRQIRAADIGGHLSDEVNALRLKQLKAGELDVLTATRMLDEGVDIPTLKFGINMVPSTSPVRIKQLFGRLLRQDGRNTEGVFVDFVDRKTGIAKGQYTALHALGLLDFDMTRIIGMGNPANRPLVKIDSHYEFGPEVYAMLQKSHGKTLQDIVMPRNERSVFDALYATWNRTLTEEGMPEELPYNPVLDRNLAARVEVARLALATSLEREPNGFEVGGTITTTRDRAEAIGEYGIRLAWDDAGDEITRLTSEYSDDPSFHSVLDSLLQDQIGEVLQTLSEREAGVVKLRFGLVDG